ncbi:lipopolysaccharide 1,2-glucosyltransferase [Enterobacteriaceae bacterium H11S18]|uniref:glycosyltransferase family 8 protein n=1 Tax=Dryocola clanedunensis TaxID=2925396 RepID=UPI0022F0D608|nr:glycosyltransferase [Dryocola clanedunensis]MCT4709906.1 lipopolysaccharide 1,2-glucosyltransferase [Dryocola clanedunensis]
MDSFPEIEIAEFKVYDGCSKTDNTFDKLNIAYGVDRNYLDGVGVSITSIVMHNDVPVTFHIIADEYDKGFLDKIEKLAIQFKISIHLYLINALGLEILPRTKVWSRAMYFRLFAFEFLSQKVDKLLYLDADVVCKGKIDELASFDLKNSAAAVVRDVESMQSKVVERLKMPELCGNYFNSGVVYANLKKWVEFELTEKALRILTQDNASSPSYKYPDQDVLNILLKDNVIFLPQKFNTIYTIKSELRDKSHNQYKKIILDETILIHYTGATKPWHEWASYPSTHYYQQALSLSPWKDDTPKKAKTVIEFKKRYKHLLVQHKYFQGIVAGIAYLRKKRS